MLGPHPSRLAQSLKGIHRGVLLLLVAIVAAISLHADAEDRVPPAQWTVPGFALALGIVFSRSLAQSRRMSPIARPWLLALSLLCAALLGLVGLAAALDAGAIRTGLGFALGALILAIRPPRLAPIGSQTVRR